ncbi:GrxA family glutaredoxin [Klebsiella phage phiKp_21]|uniref:Glutaredoxin domain-containing protein n=1 Tax=Klebsiella phage vB_KleM_RaK2 TaxID=1147094 RepID=H6X3J0_9CAUD|nr:hypothetical protein F403_gp502 [Klebsiella phage vB_KleM_RaK2]YP_010842922.1 glutaredoxin [Klebsiella phage K64-1]QOE32442.1 glutaredoxin [Klebsiella phage Muenster]UYL05466.1 glutaredoxin 1 [Klebsiella phage KP13-7]BEH88007.1 GrxA family glutaredoxin [Klebsiella phage phiKp_21]AFA44306.1 hypothetical protein RaK2_00033 [Klebsiella phage vB_KleM_RaK2]
MKVTIYGRSSGCKWCDTAKAVCETNGFDMTFIDIDSEGIDANKLAEICGEPVRSVPQIFVNGEFVKGGCTGFVEGLKEGKFI